METLHEANILVVDDEEFARDVTVRALVALGTGRPLQANSGRAALAALNDSDSRIDLIICDLAMPDMDGVELVRHLAERRSPPSIVFLSGGRSSLLRAAEALARAYGLDVKASLAKPVTRTGLLAALDGLSIPHTSKGSTENPDIDEEDLSKALSAQEFCFHYQPKIRIKDRKLDSVEALVRWQHPEYGLLSPAVFVPLVEASPLIGPFTEYLVEMGFRQLSDWYRNGLKIPMAINLPPATLSDVTLPDRFATLAKSMSLEPRNIIFEITETGIAKDEAIYLEIVTRLHMKGFRLSIDDFGTGQSSLQKLEALPFSELKVDRQFVHEAHKNEAKRAILEVSLGLAKAFELKTIAEGVELPEDLQLLHHLDCDVVQGFVFSRPLAQTDLVAWAMAEPGRLSSD